MVVQCWRTDVFVRFRIPIWAEEYCKCIGFLQFGVFQYFFARDVFDTKSFVCGLIAGNSQLKGGGHLWFVPVILMCYLITPLLHMCWRGTSKNRHSFIYYAVCSVVLASVFFFFFSPYFNPAWMSCNIIGYILGINEQDKFVKNKYVFILICVLTIICNSFQVYFTYIARVPISIVFCDYSHVLLGVFLFLLMKNVFDRMNLLGVKKLLDTTDKYSYEAYLVHQFFILGPFSLMKLTSQILLNILIIVVAILVFAILVKNMADVFEQVFFKDHRKKKHFNL